MVDEQLLETLMKLIQDRDHKAFETFYELTVDKLTIFIKSQTDLDVEDILSQAYVIFWEKSQQFDPKKGGVKSWMLTITKNLMISENRKRKDTSSIEDFSEVIEDENLDVKSEANTKLDSENMYKVLSLLKEDFKNVLIFRFLEGFSIAETAEVMEISQANVRTMQHRALKELGKLMKK